MATEARLVGMPDEEYKLVPSGGYVANQLVQAPSGRAGYMDRPYAATAGERNVTIRTNGVIQLPCDTAITATEGDDAWWDSANDTVLTYPAAAGWRLGTFHVAKFSWVLTADVALNRPRKQPGVLVKTADYTATLADSGAVFSNVGAAGIVVIGLPAAIPGAKYAGRVGVAQALRFDPTGSETVSLPVTGVVQAAGKYLTCSTIGGTINLECIVAGTWSVISSSATWTVEA